MYTAHPIMPYQLKYISLTINPFYPIGYHIPSTHSI